MNRYKISLYTEQKDTVIQWLYQYKRMETNLKSDKFFKIQATQAAQEQERAFREIEILERMLKNIQYVLKNL